MVVQVALCYVSFILRSQHRTHQFFGSCFAIAACDGDERNSEPFAVKLSQHLQAFQHIWHLYYFAVRRMYFFIHNGVGRTFINSHLRKQIAIKIRPRQGKENVTLFQFAGIGLHRWKLFKEFVELFGSHGVKWFYMRQR